MKSGVDCPKIEGWVAIKLKRVNQNDRIIADHASNGEDGNQIEEIHDFTKVFLVVDEGSLRWYNHNNPTLAKGCGFILSSVRRDQVLLYPGTKDQTQAQILVFQVLTQQGLMIMSLLVKSLKIWLPLLDLHYLHYCQDITNLPSYFYQIKNFHYHSYDLQHTIHFTIQNQHYEINITLFDSIEEITDQFMNQYQNSIPKNYRSLLMNRLYHEQNNMLFFLLKNNYQKMENENQQLKLQLIQMEQKAFLSELHANHLYDKLQSIESMLPALQKKLQTPPQPNYEDQHQILPEDEPAPFHPSSSGSVVPNTEFREISFHNLFQPPEVHHPLSASGDLPFSSPLHDYPLPNSPIPAYETPSRADDRSKRSSSPISSLHLPRINWKQKYEDCYTKLQITLKEKQQIQKDLQYTLNQQPKQQQVQSLTLENQQLRELTNQMKEEIVSLHNQIDEIQKTAFQAMEALQNQNQSPHHQQEEEDDEEEEDQQAAFSPNKHAKDRRLSLTEPEDENEYINDMYEKYKQQIHHQQSNKQMQGTVHNKLPPPGKKETVIPVDDYDAWKLQPMGDSDWTVNYYDVITNNQSYYASNSISQHVHLYSLLHSIRWPWMEESLLTIIYHHYCVANKNGMTLTSFLRFAKDFNVLVLFNNNTSNTISDGNHNNSSPLLPTTEQLVHGIPQPPPNHLMNRQYDTYEIMLESHQQDYTNPLTTPLPPKLISATRVSGGGSRIDGGSTFVSDNANSFLSHVTITNGLTNGEMSVIFTTVSKIDTFDTKRRTQLPIFKVRSVSSSNQNNMTDFAVKKPYSTSAGLSSTGSSSLLSPPASGGFTTPASKVGGSTVANATALSVLGNLTQTSTNNNAVNTIISKNQFFIALQMIANKLYAHLIEIAAGNMIGNSSGASPLMSPRSFAAIEETKQKEMERVAMELFLIKIMVPNMIQLEMIPWSLVFLEQSFSYIYQEKKWFYRYYLPSYEGIIFHYFYYFTIYQQFDYITPLTQLLYLNPTATTKDTRISDALLQYLQNQVRITFQGLIKLFRQCSFIPYLIQEPQLYSVFREVLSYHNSDNTTATTPMANWKNCNNVDFPKDLFATKKKKKSDKKNQTQTRSSEMEGLEGVGDQSNFVGQENEWSYYIYHEFTEYLLVQLDSYSHWAILQQKQLQQQQFFQDPRTMMMTTSNNSIVGTLSSLGSPISPLTSGKSTSGPKKKEESLSLSGFILLIQCISIQVFPNLMYSKRMENMMEVMKRHLPQIDSEINL